MAISENIAIKSPAGIFEITPSKEIRTNPSPSNDPWFDVPENIEHLNKAIEESAKLDITKQKSFTSVEELKKAFEL